MPGKIDRVCGVKQDTDKKQNNGLIGHNCGVLVITVTLILLDSMRDFFYNKNLLRNEINFIFNIKTNNSYYFL